MAPELIADYECVTGEGPLWHPDEGRLYWVDIPKGRLFRYCPASGAHEMCHEGEQIGGFTIQQDGSLLLFMARGAVAVWRDGQLDPLVDELPGETDSRFNDVIADPLGGVFCGTMPAGDRLGHLYRMGTDGTITEVLDGIGCSNGMGFTPDGTGMYYIDSPKREVYLFDYDGATGAIANQRVFVRTPDGEGVPDGMTVDAEGGVWVAKWDGGCAVRYLPDGTEDRRIDFPARQVSCVTFGGDGYADMYATTAGGQDRAKNGPGAGALFRVDAGVGGVPEFRSRIGPGAGR